MSRPIKGLTGGVSKQGVLRGSFEGSPRSLEGVFREMIFRTSLTGSAYSRLIFTVYDS